MNANELPSNRAPAIITAACELFANSGFEAVSVAEIAHRAGVSKANIFHHFKSKDALYLEVLKQGCRKHADFTDALLKADVPSIEKLKRLAEFDLADMFDNEVETQLFMREIFNYGHADGRSMAEEVFEHNFEVIVELFRQGQARGDLRPDFDAATAAWMFASNLIMYFHTHQMRRRMPVLRPIDQHEVFGMKILEIFLQGVAAPESSAAAGAP